MKQTQDVDQATRDWQNQRQDSPHRGEILVADDTPANLKLITQLLLNHHYKVRPVASAQAALNAINTQLPELVLLDVRMPDMNGFDVCQLLKRQPHTQHLPIIFITALDSSDDQLRGFQVGGVDFITKPFEDHIMLARIATHLALARANRQLAADRAELAEKNAKLAQTQIALQRYLTIVNQYVSTCTIDPEGFILDASKAFCQLSGYTKTELVGRPFQSCIGNPKLPNNTMAELWQTLQSGLSWHGELMNRSKDGSDYWVQMSIEPDVDETGELASFTLIQTDITDKKKIEQQSKKDPLTGLWNRRRLDEIIAEEWQRTRRHLRPLCIIMVDIDHFKQVNDNFSHLLGDRILIEFASLLRHHVRITDSVGRWGGEEFVVICPEANAEEGRQIGEKLRRMIEAHRFPEIGHLTASFGVADLQHKETADRLLLYADKALLLAKRNGRNRVQVATSDREILDRPTA